MRILALDLPNLPELPRHKNLRDFRVRFNARQPVSVVLGGNGTGKSNFIEALVLLFRDFDLGAEPKFPFRLTYRCREHFVRVDSLATGRKDMKVTINGQGLPFSRFASDEGKQFRPAHVFGYYSGPSNRLEEHFEKHQEHFYRDLINDISNPLRPLFYARPVHSQFVLLSFFSYPEAKRREFLKELLGIEALDSVLFVLRKPPWAQSKPSAQVRALGDDRFWFARGRVQWLLDRLHSLALAPLRLTSKVAVDFRRKATTEHVYLYLRDNKALLNLADGFSGTADFFKALESLYISKLLAEVRIRVRIRNVDGALTFRELSEGEQQLLTVLGLLEFTKEDESLFLLDEPDTHLNPAWSMNYVQMLRQIVNESHKSHLIMATHDPLVICELVRPQVKVLRRDDKTGLVTARPPALSPRGLGVAGILTSDMFGLRSTIDRPTLTLIDRRYELFGKGNELTDAEKQELADLTDRLARLGFNREFSDPYFVQFASAMARQKEARKKILTPEDRENLEHFADKVVGDLLAEESK